MRERSSCVSQKWQQERAAALGIHPVQRDKHHESRKKRRVWWPDEDSVALLIDGDHMPAQSMSLFQSYAERLGPLPLHWVYGNWAAGYLKSWQQILRDYRLEARHCRPVAFGKNGADIALTVDAMLLYDEGVRKFVLAASDSDYTPLVETLRALDCIVMVIGKASTPLALQQAASAFRLIDSAAPERQVPVVYERARAAHAVVLPQADRIVPSDAAPEEAMPLQPGAAPEQVEQWVLQRLKEYESTPHGWVQVPGFYDALRSLFQFRPKDYRYKDIITLLRSFPETFELRPYQEQVHIHEVRQVKG